MMSKNLLLLAVILCLFSCARESDKNELLTSMRWTESIAGGQKVSESLKFQEDGTFISEAGPIQLNGKWSWKGENEIYLQVGGMTAEGETNQFDTSSNYFIRILEISDKGMKTLEVHEGDTWESGFAQERNYTPQNL